MKGHKLISEHPNHFQILSPDGKSFPIAKHALSMHMMTELSKLPKHMYEGSQADETVADQDLPTAGNQNLANSALDMLLSGGPGAPPGSSYIENVPQMATKAADAVKHTGLLGDQPEPVNPQPISTGFNVAANDMTGVNPQTPSASPSDGNIIRSQPDIMAGLTGAMGEQKAAVQAGAEAQKGVAAQSQDILRAQATELTDQKERTDAQLADLDAQGAKIQDAVAQGKIDPGRLWNSSSTANKVGMLASVIIGGLGSGGDANNNLAMKVINENINRDIESQKADMGKNRTLWEINMNKYHNVLAADNATRLNILQGYKGQLDMAAAKAGGPIAQANADAAKAQIDVQIQQLKANQAIFLRNSDNFSPQNGGQEAPSAGGVDVNKMRAALSMAGQPGAPSKEQAAAMLTEYQDYSKINTLLGTVDNAFKKVDQLQNLASRVGDPVQSKSQIDSTEKIFSAQLAKDLEGRATPQDIDSIMENFPKVTDDAQTRMVKLNNIKDSIKAKAGSFRNMQIFGVLNPTDETANTSIAAANRAKSEFRPKASVAQGQK